MHDEELLYYSLKRIASTIEKIINNSQAIDDSQYYVLSPAGMERLESTCMLLLAIGESIKGIKNIGQAKSKPTWFCLRMTDCHIFIVVLREKSI